MRDSEEAKKEINSNVMEETIGAIDWISQLPEDIIIHHILSKLFTKDIIRTSVLSKTWQHMWASFPIFYFDQNQFGKDLSTIENQETEIQEKRDMFMKFVDDTLHRLLEQQISIHRFVLVMTLFDIKYAHRIDHWIELATKDNVLKLLDINILGPTGDPSYSLPRFTSGAKSLAILRLKGCRLEQPSFDDFPKFHYLHEMCLVDVYASEQIINNLICCCPSIENLSFRSCSGIKVLKIPNLPKLKKVEVDQDGQTLLRIGEVKIEARELTSFHYNGGNFARKIDIARCKNMRELTLINSQISADFLESLISIFKFLKSLDLQGCNNLKRVVIRSPRLERLSLKCLSKLVVAQICAPKLNSFVCSSDIMQSVFSINSSRPLKATLDLNIDEHFNTILFLQLREFIKKFSSLQVLYLHFCSSEVSFNSEELRDIFTHRRDRSLRYLKRLTINILDYSPNYGALVDGLFWSTHPKRLTILSGGFSTALIKSLCERLMDREENQHCCSSTHIKCWRHYLKDVKIIVTAVSKRTYTFDCKDLMESLPTVGKWSEVHFKLKW